MRRNVIYEQTLSYIEIKLDVNKFTREEPAKIKRD